MPVTQVVIGTQTANGGGTRPYAAWLSAGAAASWKRMEAAGKPTGGITEAGRTRARQQHLYEQYLAGNLQATAARPGTSLHETGTAVDVATWSGAQKWLIAHGAEHGWSRPLLHAAKPEPWHWQYDLTRDQHLADAPAPDPIQEDIVATLQELEALLDARTPAGGQHVWRKLIGANLAWIDLGTARRRGTDLQYAGEAIPKPPLIGGLSALDPFWALPVVGDAWGELYKLPDDDDAWLLESQDGRAVRRWPGREAYLAKGAPPIITLPAANDFWLLPPVRREGVA